jgi:hypothetical protein
VPAIGELGVNGAAALSVVSTSPGVVVVALKTGEVPAVDGPGTTGMLMTLSLPAVIGPALTQVTVWPLVVQVLPFELKLAGAETPAGSVTVVVTGPAGPEPVLATVIGNVLVTPSLRDGVGWPIVVERSGVPAIDELGVSGAAALLPVLLSPGVVVVALKTGEVPTVDGPGTTGTLMTLSLPAVIGPALTQVTVWPLVVQVLPFDEKLAGAETPAGNVTVVVTGPAAAEPVLLTVTGKVLVTPSLREGVGWPIVVERSGAAAAVTGELGVSGAAALSVVSTSPGVVVVALKTGEVPTVDGPGTTGTLMTLSLPAVIGPALTQVTVWPLVVQVLPFELKLAGAETPVGSVIVLVTGPAGPEPVFVTVIGTVLVTPTTSAGEG